MTLISIKGNRVGSERRCVKRRNAPRGVSNKGLRRQRIVEAIEILIGGSALLAVLYGACVYIGACLNAIEVA